MSRGVDKELYIEAREYLEDYYSIHWILGVDLNEISIKFNEETDVYRFLKQLADLGLEAKRENITGDSVTIRPNVLKRFLQLVKQTDYSRAWAHLKGYIEGLNNRNSDFYTDPFLDNVLNKISEIEKNTLKIPGGKL